MDSMVERAKMKFGPWHVRFAWRPVWIGSGYVWLEPVEQRHCTDMDAFPLPRHYLEYRRLPPTPTDIS